MAEFTKDEPFEFKGQRVHRTEMHNAAMSMVWVDDMGIHDSRAAAIHAFIEAERDEWAWTNDEHTEARRGRWVAIHNFGDVWHYRHEDFPGIFWDSHEDGTRGTPTILNLHDTLLAWKSAQEQPAEPTGLGAVVEVDGRRFVRDDDHAAYPWHEVGLMNRSWQYILALGPVTVLSPGVDA